MEKDYLKLSPSESVVIQCATQIYSAYIVTGKVTDENENEMREKSIQEAIKIAKRSDHLIISDTEIGK